MCILQIQAQCYDKFFEVSPDEPENAELMVEDMISRILLAFFGGGTVDDVAIDFPADQRMGLLHCSIQIRAQCSCQYFALFPCTKEHIRHCIEKSAKSLLRELFGSVKIERIMMSPSASDSENDATLSWRG